MSSEGMLLVISAPSGAGKTTIAKEVLRQFPRFRFSVSATTRKRRPGEVDGKDYFFLSRDDFEKLLSEDGLVEHEEIYSEYYGTPRSEIDKALKKGENIVFDVDVNGALSIKNKYPEAVLIFIKPPSVEALEERLKGRGSESAEQIKRRLARVPMELEKGRLFDYIIVNDKLEIAVKEVFDIVSMHLSKGDSGKEPLNGTKAN
ncbi:MAG: guanylate kinase [Bacteroidetes bacterium]|nr:guanylate kinase [Bacteroidota bacterium]